MSNNHSFNTARKRYQPDCIKTLLIAEGPPESLNRFFYFEDVKSDDSLFLEIMSVLYPMQKIKYLNTGRSTDLKKQLLDKFKSDGYWLLDLSEIPKQQLTQPIELCLNRLVTDVKKCVNDLTKIILIKVNVFDCCYSALKAEGFNVSQERMPFPGSGQQRLFREKFWKALKSSGRVE